MKGLSYRVNYSPNVRFLPNYSYRRQDPYLTSNLSFARKINTNSYDWVLENILTFKRQLNVNHYVDLTLMQGRNHRENETTSANSNQLVTDVLGWNNLGLGTTLTNTSGGDKTDGVSYMFRTNYNFKKRYLATFTVRRDGSSVFAENNKYATFPSGSLAWIISDETFLSDSRILDLLKIRLSYGAVGNQAIRPYQSISVLGTTRYVFSDGGASSLGFFPNNMGNSDLKWETTYAANLGLDFELLKGRVGGTVELYNMDTKDLLVTRSLPTMTGYASVWTNLGQINNKGIEITLNTINVRKQKFEWRTNFTFSANRNKIVHLYGSDTDGDGKEDDDLGNRWFIGQPITTYFDYVQDGIYQVDDEIPSGFVPGDVRLKDLNDNGIIDADDRTIIGHGGQPKYRWGISNDLVYGPVTLSVFVNAMQGWISNLDLLIPPGDNRQMNFLDYGWWTPENRSNVRPSTLYKNRFGHKFYLSRDFVRIQDVTLSYNVPNLILEKIRVSNMRVSLSGKNLYTFTDWVGQDPESGSVDRTSLYPMPRTITLGLNMSF